MKLASIFAGVGGFDLGFEQAGIEVVAQVEIDPHRQRVLEANWPNLLKGDDIVTTQAADIDRPDIIVGGFPCQETSIAGPRRPGLAGSRSGKFWDFHRLIDEHLRLIDATNPRWVVIENPPGLLKSPGKCADPNRVCRAPGCTGKCGADWTGWDMAAVTRGLEDIGYGWAYRVVDAGSVGSAQRRQRVLIVGHLGGDPRPAWEVLGDGGAGSQAASPSAKRGLANRPSAASSANGLDEPIVWRKSARARASLAKGGYETWVESEFSNVLTGFDGGAATRQTHLVLQGGRLRTLTHIEWERLQGFPDNWTSTIPDSHRYQVIGDAMNVHQAAWLGKRIVSVEASLPLIGVRP